MGFVWTAAAAVVAVVLAVQKGFIRLSLSGFDVDLWLLLLMMMMQLRRKWHGKGGSLDTPFQKAFTKRHLSVVRCPSKLETFENRHKNTLLYLHSLLSGVI